jgi:Zinc knuckle
MSNHSNVECYNCGKHGHYTKQCKSNVECYNCGKYGHYAKECYSEKKVEENANLVAEEETKDDGVLMMAYKNTIPDSDTVWYLDTGASNHMCGHKHLFTEMQEVEDGHVSFGDASKVRVKGRGKIYFSQKDGKEGSIEDIYHVPDLKSNILSMGQLLEMGYLVFMKDRMLYLKDKKDWLVARVEMAKNRMFKLNLRNVRERCLHVNMEKIKQFSSLVDEWRGKAEEREIRLEEVHELEKCKTKSLASAIQQLEEKEQLLENLHQAELQVKAASKAMEEARTESLQLKERLLDKENELQSITQKNDELRACQSKAEEKIVELSSQLKEVATVEKV